MFIWILKGLKWSWAEFKDNSSTLNNPSLPTEMKVGLQKMLNEMLQNNISEKRYQSFSCASHLVGPLSLKTVSFLEMNNNAVSVHLFLFILKKANINLKKKLTYTWPLTENTLLVFNSLRGGCLKKQLEFPAPLSSSYSCSLSS